MDYPGLTFDERVERQAFLSTIAMAGVGIRFLQPGKTQLLALRAPEEGRGQILFVEDDPQELGLPSRGPKVFHQRCLLAYRDVVDVTIIEIAKASRAIMVEASGILMVGKSVLWVISREEHEAEWLGFAQGRPTSTTPPTYSILLISPKPEGSA